MPRIATGVRGSGWVVVVYMFDASDGLVACSLDASDVPLSLFVRCRVIWHRREFIARSNGFVFLKCKACVSCVLHQQGDCYQGADKVGGQPEYAACVHIMKLQMPRKFVVADDAAVLAHAQCLTIFWDAGGPGE